MPRGMHLRLSADAIAPLLAAADDADAVVEAVTALEEQPVVFARGCETDKAWDPITCALAPDGADGPWPARGVIGGARDLLDDEEVGWVTHSDPAETAEIAAFLAALADESFRAAYTTMPEALRNPEYGDVELGYALANLHDLRAFFAAASSAGEHVVFSVWG